MSVSVCVCVCERERECECACLLLMCESQRENEKVQDTDSLTELIWFTVKCSLVNLSDIVIVFNLLVDSFC